MHNVIKAKMMQAMNIALFQSPQFGHLDANLKSRVYQAFMADADTLIQQTIIPKHIQQGLDDNMINNYAIMYINEAVKILTQQNQFNIGNMYQQQGMFNSAQQIPGGQYQVAQFQNMFNSPIPQSVQCANQMMPAPQQTFQNPSNKGAEKMVVVEDVSSWELGDSESVVVDNQIVRITRVPAEVNGEKVFVGDAIVKCCVSGYNEAIKIVAPYIKTKKRLLNIDYIQSIPVAIDNTIFSALRNEYNSRLEILGGLPTVSSMKKLFDVLFDFMGGMSAKQAEELERYFMSILRPLIRSTIIHPDKLRQSIITENLKDVYELLDDIETRGYFSDCDFYDNVLIIVLMKGLIDSIDANNSLLTVDHLGSRLDMIRSMYHHKVINTNLDSQYFFVSEEDAVKDLTLKNKYIEVWDALNKLVVCYTTSGVIYSNIVPSDMQYKCGEPGFEPYAFTEPKNIIEGLISRTHPNTYYRKNNIVLEFSKFKKIDCVYGRILDKSVRIAANEIEY